MNTELRKRFEEAAVEEQRKVTPHKEWGDVNYGFIKGAEYGYKEAIAQAKEWMKNNGYLATNGWYTIKGTIADFETDMNKLWEEQK